MKFILLLTCLFSVFSLFSQESQVWLHPNKGQWDQEILYKVDAAQGSILLDQKGFTYFLNSASNHQHHDKEDVAAEQEAIKIQVVKVHFEGSTWDLSKTEGALSSHYRNYFQGKDPTKWKSNVHSIASSRYHDFYPGIDMEVAGGDKKLKYSFFVQPGIDPSIIRSKISGSKSIFLEDGNLHIVTEFGDIIEEKPIAWTIKDRKKQKVKVEFKLKNNELVYHFPDGYDETAELVIDPNIVFSTFTGSTMDNWGMSATPDNQGNLYAGGIVFSGGGTYPTTPGVFDASFNNGQPYTVVMPNGASFSMNGFDVAISKFNATGTSLLFSTYLGGNDNESIHSMVTDDNDNLYVFGVTGSTNFPMTPGCFDPTHNGGPFIGTNELGFNGADIYITRFNAAGSALVGSTFIGGNDTDGINGGSLFYNYGDPFRGEIIVKNGFVYLASSTNSANFPTISASQGSISGTQDAVAIKINDLLTTVSWSTYFGGTGFESGNGIQLSSANDVYLTGGTTTSNLGFSLGHDLSYNGGVSDGYIVRLNNATSAQLSGTYIGTSDYDQSFFVQLDTDDDVYVYGQTEGSIPVSAGCYGVANSGQFIAKYSTNLTNQLWTTSIGAGSGHAEISPTAFLVSNCKDIYLTGWGGEINQAWSPGAGLSTTFGFPVTVDAVQATTNGSNFWIAVLDEDAASLKYATFMGGLTTSSNHVDGGTSRFDKNGNIYHAVCGACGGVDFGFTTTPGVWSPTNQSFNCNLAAFKFELSSIEAIVSTPDPLICLPDPVVFNNNSANGNEFSWDFGDGSTSNLVNPSHVYSGPGQYTVTLVVKDTNQCFAPDSIEFIVNIGDFQGGVIDPDILICPGQTAQLEAFGGNTYLWSPAQFLNNPAIANPIATVTQSTLFTCIISDSCGIDTVQVQVNMVGANVNVSADTSICIGNSVPLFIDGVVSAVWTPAQFLDNPTSLTPISTPTNTITYQVTGTTVDGCQLLKNVTIQVFFDPPAPVIPDTLKYCEGTSGTLTVSGAETYTWNPTVNITPSTGPTVVISTSTEQYYYCLFTNACAAVLDSVYIDLVQPTITAGFDTTVCPGQVAYMQGFGGVSYSWSPSVSPITPNYDSVSVIAPATTTYMVYGTDQYGCVDSASVTITLFPQPFIQTNPDVFGVAGEQIQLYATSTTTGQYVWSPAEYLSCVVCPDPIAQPDQNFTYTVTYTDENGCTASDIVRISYDPLIYVPNTFTPNGNTINELFFALGVNIGDFNMEIYNRWGELIYTGDRMAKSWDGTYQGLPCPDGVYVWKIRYGDLYSDKVYEIVGHVNLLR